MSHIEIKQNNINPIPQKAPEDVKMGFGNIRELYEMGYTGDEIKNIVDFLEKDKEVFFKFLKEFDEKNNRWRSQ